MNLLPLATQYVGSMKIFGWIAIGVGWVMNLVYEGLCMIGINNIGVAIIVLTVLIYTAMLPLTYRQQKFSKLMQIMNPELKAMQAKYKDRKDAAAQQEMMEEQQQIYDKYGVSPTGSCVQSLLSLFILLPLYRVIYNVPAYVTRVKETLMPAVEGIMATDGYQTIFDEVVADFNISLANIGVSDVTISSLDTADIPNRIVDILYKLSPDNWSALSDAFSGVDLTSVQTAFNQINNFCLLNVTNSPMYIFNHNIKGGSIPVAIVALMIPALAAITQWIGIKLIPQTTQDANDPTSQQMKTMNMMMPVMSLIFCFTLPVGLGIYWISGAVIRGIYQALLNRHFQKMDVEKIIAKNLEKAEKKKEKRGIDKEQVRAAAKVNTRNLGLSSDITDEERSRLLDAAEEIKKDAREGSMAKRAAMVKEYNERNSGKSNSRKGKSKG